MRKLILTAILGLLPAVCHATCQNLAPSYTTNMGLEVPQINSCSWGIATNNNWSIIDSSAVSLGAANVFVSTNTFNYPVLIKSANPLRLYDSSTHFIELKASGTVVSTSFVLPSADGSSGQAITTNGNGTLAFSTVLTTATTNFIMNQGTLQSGATFYVSSGTTNSLTVSTLTINNEINGSKIANNPPLLVYNADSLYMNLTGTSRGSVNTLNLANTAFGVGALSATQVLGIQNTAFGHQAAQSMGGDASFNTAIGFRAMGGGVCNSGSICFQNTAVGELAMSNNGGGNNVGVGVNALQFGTGNFNTALGSQAGYDLTTASSNTFVGYLSGEGLQGGRQSTTGDGNTFIGYGTSISTTTQQLRQSIAIGYAAIVRSSFTAQIGGTNGSGNEVMLNASSATFNQVLVGASSVGVLATTQTWTGQNTFSSQPATFTSSVTLRGAVEVAGGNKVLISSNAVLPGATFYQAGDIVLSSTLTFSPTTLGIRGTTTNDNANVGNYGEYISSTVSSASPITMVSGAAKNVASASLTAGDWDVSGLVGYIPGGTMNYGNQSISLVTNTIGSESAATITVFAAGTTPAVGAEIFTTPVVRVSISVTTTVYLTAQSVFGTSMTTYGTLRARRVR